MQKRFLSGVGCLAMMLSLAGCEVKDEIQPQAGRSGKQAQKSDPPSTPEVKPEAPRLMRGNLRFVEGYRAGAELAAQTKKPMLLFFTAEWCHFCHQMANEAFTDEQVVNLSDRFVCVLVDADREPQICQHYGVRAFPTIQFVSSRGQQLHTMVGKKSAHDLVREMHSALQALARVTVETKTL